MEWQETRVWKLCEKWGKGKQIEKPSLKQREKMCEDNGLKIEKYFI